MAQTIIKAIVHRLFVQRWQRKVFAIVAASVIWLGMNMSMTVTRTLADVSVRIVNLPADKTVEGMLPSGLLDDHLTVTVVGTKSLIDELQPSDLEVVLDAAGKGREWIAHVDRKTLVSKNPAVDLGRGLKDVVSTEFIVSTCPLITEQIQVVVVKPIGEAPAGWQYLDVWPQTFTQTITGPEAQIQHLKTKGMKLFLDLNKVDATRLAELGEESEEVSFPVPEEWKKLNVNFMHTQIPLSDPTADAFHINFLKRSCLSLELSIPVYIYYPPSTLKSVNPTTLRLAPSDKVRVENNVTLYAEPLFAKDVSSLFLEVVSSSLEIVITASKSGSVLNWGVDFVNPRELEELYVERAMAEEREGGLHNEDSLRERFRIYMRQLQLVTKDQQPLQIHPVAKEGEVLVN